jgi:hypothetical protein
MGIVEDDNSVYVVAINMKYLADQASWHDHSREPGPVRSHQVAASYDMLKLRRARVLRRCLPKEGWSAWPATPWALSSTMSINSSTGPMELRHSALWFGYRPPTCQGIVDISCCEPAGELLAVMSIPCSLENMVLPGRNSRDASWSSSGDDLHRMSHNSKSISNAIGYTCHNLFTWYPKLHCTFRTRTTAWLHTADALVHACPMHMDKRVCIMYVTNCAGGPCVALGNETTLGHHFPVILRDGVFDYAGWCALRAGLGEFTDLNVCNGFNYTVADLPASYSCNA